MTNKALESNHVLNLIRTTVRQQEPNARIILYGSRARGDARPDSDWDVLILLDKPKMTADQRGDITYNLWFKGMENNVDIDAFAYTMNQWNDKPLSLYKVNVANEGIEL